MVQMVRSLVKSSTGAETGPASPFPGVEEYAIAQCQSSALLSLPLPGNPNCGRTFDTTGGAGINTLNNGYLNDGISN